MSTLSESLLGLIVVILAIIAVALTMIVLHQRKQPVSALANNSAVASSDIIARSQLARWLIICSGIGLVVVSIVVIYFAKAADTDKTSTMVFNTLVPLFGTWVGTVIAFYFSSANYKAATDGVRDLVKQLTPAEKLASVPVTQAMISRQNMKVVTLQTTANAAQAAIDTAADAKNLQTDINPMLRGQNAVSRIPVLDQNDVSMFIIHESLLYQYGAVADNPPDVPIAAQRTLRNFLNYNNNSMRDRVSNTRAFVSASASLADAKTAMDKVNGCQDVFVTQTGQSTEPVLGMLTNVDILNYAKA
jgi:predicted lipoprotein